MHGADADALNCFQLHCSAFHAEQCSLVHTRQHNCCDDEPVEGRCQEKYGCWHFSVQLNFSYMYSYIVHILQGKV